MAQIKIKVFKGDNEVANKTTDISSNTLPDLIAFLRTAKAETNQILSDLVDKEKSSNNKKSARIPSEDEDEDEEESDEIDEEKASKKQKTSNL